MDNYRRVVIAVCILFLVLSSLMIYERYNTNIGHDKVRKFQQLACGFGLGASVNPKWGFMNFDLRIDTIDETVLFPVPGGYSYSPDTGMSLTAMPEINITPLSSPLPRGE